MRVPTLGFVMEMLGTADRFVVVDVETTGLSNKDRVVEVAAVTVDRDGTILEEWDSLVDPGRDVGPTDLHGITAAMVSAAPTFSEIAAALAHRLYGAVLVAHNLPFDRRMLVKEFERLGATFHPGNGICTMQLAGGKLADACRRRGIETSHAHRALGDARAAARLLAALARSGDPAGCARVNGLSTPYSGRTLQREMVGGEDASLSRLGALVRQLHHFGERGAMLAYLDLLDRAVSDLHVCGREREALVDLASSLGMDMRHVEEAHRHYVDELIAAAVRDGVVTDEEHLLLVTVAEQLGVPLQVVDEGTAHWREAAKAGVTLEVGTRICFTGTAVDTAGNRITRRALADVASALGLVVVKGVGATTCDVVVAADPTSQSGKAKRARELGLPIVAVADFLVAQPSDLVPAA